MEDDFPYKFYSLPEDYPTTAMQALIDFEPIIIYKDFVIGNLDILASELVDELGTSEPFILEGHQYELYGSLSDCFNEEARMKARVRRSSSNKSYYLSPFDYWNANKDDIAKKFGLTFTEEWYNEHSEAKAGGAPEEVKNAREYLWNLTKQQPPEFKEAGTFRSTIVISIIQKYFPNRKIKVLDFSAGWGDRPLAVISQFCDYTGVDPNPETNKGYRYIADTYDELISDNNLEITFIESGLEDAEIEGEFDLSITSPPYFDFEDYAEGDNQSIKRYKDLDDWYENFLLFSARKALSLLKPNGILVYIINDAMSNYTMRFVRDVSKLCTFLTVGGYGEAAPQPIWIWQKK